MKEQQSNPSYVHLVSFKALDLSLTFLASSQGPILPPNLKFESFTSKAPNGGSEVLLHSTTHPTIDFTATENDSHNDKHLKHYVAVFDPATGELQVTGAKRLTARSSVRRREAAESEDGESGEETQAVTNYSSRAALTDTFGTKKSKKAVQSMAENRLLARGGDDANNSLSKAILSSIPESDMPEDTDTRQLAQSNKPLPVPNLHTDDVNLAYPLTSLVFPAPPASTLDQLPLSAWIDSVSTNKPVNAASRFVANRIVYLIRAHTSSPEDATLKIKVQLLRYMLLLLELSSHIRILGLHARIPPPSTWPPKTITGNLPFNLIIGTISHFFPTNQLTTPGTTLLHTTILALALHIPPPSFQVTPGTLVTEPTDLQMDLALEPELCRKYYKELGCEMVSASDGELSLWGLEKMTKKRRTEEGKKSVPKPRWAKLRLPFLFPTLSVGRRQRR